jgi:hypothetical protein
MDSVTDQDFGPAVGTENRTFDFTLLFEESILSILPWALLIMYGPVYYYGFSAPKRKIKPDAVLLAKMVSPAVFCKRRVCKFNSSHSGS